MASTRATKAPVMDAVRVPPSAWITSQSTVMERSPKAFKSTTARNARPIKRWISTVRPVCLPRAASRLTRVFVERGNKEYSAVTQPWPEPFNQRGTFSSIVAVQMTFVLPHSMSTEPSAYSVKCLVILIGLNWPAVLLSLRITTPPLCLVYHAELFIIGYVSQ